KTVDGFRPSSLRAHLLFIHQRGFSSSCTLPDPRTRLDAFQSGLIRLIHEKDDGKVVIYSRYRADACLQDNLRLPAEKITKMGNDIVRFEYDRRRPNFYHAFDNGPAPVTFDDMMNDIEQNLLFRDAPHISPDVRARSLDSIRTTFMLNAAPADPTLPKRYMGGNAPVLPALKALVAV
ncbi:MAG: hypothetical protein KJ667_02145, partial [Alphaproteobacteria bacterium]|nr:hypothetical protein [Alphaproteobacteria bacterium]